MEKYDIAIVGSGPAGITAAINARIRNKKVILFGHERLSNKLHSAPRILNYIGFYGISGSELAERFKEHARLMDIKITNERVDGVYHMADHYLLMVADRNYKASALILAPGVQGGKPFKGETNLLGKGVGYCATCDAPLYKGKTVTIVGYTQEAVDEANFISELASKVFFVPLFKDNHRLDPRIEVVDDRPLEVIGKTKVEKLKLRNSVLETDAVFILRDSITPEHLVLGLEVEDGHIKVDREMRTNLPGCYAAGDAVGKPYQFLKAMGEGQVAALNAVTYLSQLSKGKEIVA